MHFCVRRKTDLLLLGGLDASHIGFAFVPGLQVHYDGQVVDQGPGWSIALHCIAIAIAIAIAIEIAIAIAIAIVIGRLRCASYMSCICTLAAGVLQWTGGGPGTRVVHCIALLLLDPVFVTF